MVAGEDKVRGNWGVCINQPQDDKIHVLERAHPQCLVAEQ